MNMKQTIAGGFLALVFSLIGCEPAAAPPAQPATPNPAASTEKSPAVGGAESGSPKSGAADVAPPAGEKAEEKK